MAGLIDPPNYGRLVGINFNRLGEIFSLIYHHFFMNLYIFSEDLRIRDNRALYEASLEQKGLIALYIINKGKNEEHGDSLAKLKLKLLSLAEIRNPLVSLNIPIKLLPVSYTHLRAHET